MPARTGRTIGALLAAVILLLTGALLAGLLAEALALDAAPADVPVEAASPAQPRDPAAAPTYQTIVVPDGQPPITLAAQALAGAMTSRGAPEPVIGAAPGPGVTARIDAGLSSNRQAYRIIGDTSTLTITGASATATAAGLYAVADRVRSGRASSGTGEITAPRLGLRLVDMGSVGIDAEPAGWESGTDYSLNNSVVGPAILPTAPYVDEAAVEQISEQFIAHVNNALAMGYNGIVIPGFLEYVTFEGTDIYADDGERVARAQAMVLAFEPVWRYAADMGMSVYFATDMLALSPPLQEYLERTYGGLAVEDPQFWTVYQSAMAELFRAMPFASGLLIRIGEGGDVYKLPNWEFTSQIAVKTPRAVQTMLDAFLGAAARTQREIIFRTWTVGVGAVGDLHTNPDTYAEVLGPVDAENLIVSTKFTAGDFYSYLANNPTLASGEHRRIVEFQGRREYEGFGSLPNDLGPLHQQALQQFLAANPNIEGVWNWTQDGGPLRAGPYTLYLRQGFWQLFHLNTYATARLAQDPDVDPAQVTADWATQYFSQDPRTVAAIGEAMALSREAITKGLYISPFAANEVKGLGLELPSMMWIFEWDILTGDSASWSTIYDVAADDLPTAIGQGEEALAAAREMRRIVDATDATTWTDPSMREQFLASLDYQVSLFTTLAAYRELMLQHRAWLAGGDSDSSAEQAYVDARAAHEAAYGDDLALPAYNFTAADIGTDRAAADAPMGWLARLLLAALVVVVVGLGALGRSTALRALWIGATRPWRLADMELSPGRVDRVLVWLIPAAFVIASRYVYTWFAAPAHLVLVLGSWALFLLVLAWLTRGMDRFWLWAGVGGAVLLRTLILLIALISRGPGRYWFNFWTDPTRRFIYITIAFAAFLWVLAVAAGLLRHRYGIAWRGALGRVMIAAGTPLAVFGAVVAAMGLEDALTVWNDQMALLPWGLSRILGITVHLGIPTQLPLVVAVLGAVVVAAGALMLRGTGSRAVAAAS